MSSDVSERWKEKVDITYEEYFNAPLFIPHQGIVLLAKGLEEALGKEKAHQVIQEALEKYYREGVKQSRETDPVKDFKDFQSRWADITSPLMDHALEAKVLESTPNRHRMRVTKCLFAKSFREMGAPDLGYIWECHNDFVVTETGDPRARLERTRTLMQGDDCCDFTWYWEGEGS